MFTDPALAYPLSTHIEYPRLSPPPFHLGTTGNVCII